MEILKIKARHEKNGLDFGVPLDLEQFWSLRLKALLDKSYRRQILEA